MRVIHFNKKKTAETDKKDKVVDIIDAEITDSPKKRKSNSFLKIFMSVMILLLLVITTYVGYLLVTFQDNPVAEVRKLFDSCNDDSCIVKLDTPKVVCEFPPFCAPELPKTNNRTNVLVAGIDTRENGAGMLTDTIMLISYDHTDHNMYMISVPRDTYVSFRNYYGNKETTKINAVYYSAGGLKKDVDKGMSGLSKVISDMTGQQVHYYALVTLKGFTEAIDTLGGLTINIPEDHTDVYPKSELPANLQASCLLRKIPDGHFCQFTFKAGEQTLDGIHALIYARSREFSSDYSRARRQQIVVTAVKNQVLTSSTLTNPEKLSSLLDTFKKNVTTSNYNLGDIIAALSEAKNVNKSVSIVFDPAFAGGGIFQAGGSSVGYINKVLDPTYKRLQSELNSIYTYPGVYMEDPKIGVYNATGKKVYVDYVKNISSLDLPKYSFGSKNVNINKAKDVTYNLDEVESSSSSAESSAATKKVATVPTVYGVKLIDYTNGAKPDTLSVLTSKYPELEVSSGVDLKRRNNEDFAIILFEKYPETTVTE